jgi:hypothetical protein
MCQIYTIIMSTSGTLHAQGLGASEKIIIKKILYNTTRGRTHLLPFF